MPSRDELLVHALDTTDRARDSARLSEDGSVGLGLAGLALLEAYVARVTNDDRLLESAIQTLGRAASCAGLEAQGTSLFFGAVGVAWTQCHIASVHGLDPPRLTRLDSEVLRELSEDVWDRHFDLMYGAVGLGVYGLERVAAGNDVGVAMVSRVVEHLRQVRSNQPAGSAWKTSGALLSDDQRRRYPSGYFNLGLPHGTPGVVAFLCRAARLVPDVEEVALELVADSLRWLLAQEFDSTLERHSLFPAEAGGPDPSRLSWCYGDLCVVVAMLCAASALDAPHLLLRARQIAERAAQRDMTLSGVVDGCVCHGSSGLALLFSRVGMAVRSPEVLQASEEWSLAAWTRETDAATRGLTFKSGSFENDDSMLSGSVGAALAMLSVAEPHFTWDRLLLTDVDFSQ